MIIPKTIIAIILCFFILLCIHQETSAQSNADDMFAGMLEVPILAPVELDYLSKQEILDLRKELVSVHPTLYKRKYKPSQKVFGQIEDNKPWWGTLGLSYYGPGQRSIEGVSEESRFIINPFMLIGLDTPGAFVIKNPAIQPTATFPYPEKLYWHPVNQFAYIKYDASSYFQRLNQMMSPSSQTYQLTLIAYNARDFGYNYMQISDYYSNGLTASNSISKLRQYIHAGASCGYTGGCNNMSPFDRAMQINVTHLPSSAYIKLWRKKPSSQEAEADFIYIIEME